MEAVGGPSLKLSKWDGSVFEGVRRDLGAEKSWVMVPRMLGLKFSGMAGTCMVLMVNSAGSG